MSKTKTTEPVDTFALSRGYGTKSHAKRAMIVFAGTHLLTADEFDLVKIDKLHHYKRIPVTVVEAKPAANQTPMFGDLGPAIQASIAANPDLAERGITSPCPKPPVSCEIADAIKTFNDGIPDYLRVTPEEAARRRENWEKNPPRRQSSVTPRTQPTEQETEMARQISAANKKQGKPSKSTSTRYDWIGAETKAKAGTLPNPPDMSAPTHKHYLPKLQEVAKLARAGDLKGLQAYKIATERTDGSPGMVKQYHKLAIVALKAKG